MPPPHRHSRRTPKPGAAGAGKPPGTFFAAELPGETPPTFSDMEAYLHGAMSLGRMRPWELLSETQVFAVDPGQGAPRQYCSIIGEAGMVFRVVAYEGDDGYRLFRRMSGHLRMDPFSLYTSANLSYVDYCPEAELMPRDADLLKQCGMPLGVRRDVIWPVFRVIRRGHKEWHPNAREMAVLGNCVLSGIIAAGETQQGRGGALWNDGEKRIPLIGTAFAGGRAQPVIERVDRPRITEPPLPEPVIDARQLSRLLRGVPPGTDTWELGCATMPVVVGGEGERTSVPLIAFAAEAGSGYVFPFVLEECNLAGARGGLLARALLKAVEAANVIPQVARVEDAAARDCLAPLAEKLGVKLVIKKRLPAIEACLSGMVEYSFRSLGGGGLDDGDGNAEPPPF